MNLDTAFKIDVLFRLNPVESAFETSSQTPTTTNPSFDLSFSVFDKHKHSFGLDFGKMEVETLYARIATNVTGDAS